MCVSFKFYSYVIALMMGTEMVPETLESFNELVQVIVREDFVNVTRVESITYSINLISNYFCVLCVYFI
jgi:hypothetical protein